MGVEHAHLGNNKKEPGELFDLLRTSYCQRLIPDSKALPNLDKFVEKLQVD
jgi:hypothetical protein